VDGPARPRVTVVGLGPAGADLTTVGATARLAAAPVRFLRTHRHPAADPWSADPSFDHHYERATTFDDVYAAIVEDLVAAATRHGEVAYAVPGSPHVLERAVTALLADERVQVDLVPGMSFLDLAWAHLGVDPVEAGVRLVDGHRFAIDAAGATGPLLVAHCHANHVLSELKLAFDDDDEPESAIVLQRLGLPDQHIVEVAWADLDRAVEADHLTSVFVPAVVTPVASELVRFAELVRTLRQRCPWDREQTHASLTRYVVEETYEVVEAIEAYDPDTGAGVEDLEEELGDLLFQVVFHATIAAESGAFTLADVARGIHDKLHRRHPHVFGDAADDPGSITRTWEEIKREEKGRGSVMEGIPKALPALLYAHKVLSKAERVGAAVPRPADPVAIDPDGELGSALLALVAHARARGIDAEAALRAATDRLRDAAVRHETGPVTET